MPERSKTKMLLLTYGSYDHSSSRIRAFQYIPFLKNDFNLKIKCVKRVPSVKNGLLHSLLFYFQKRIYSLKRFLSIRFCKSDIVFSQRVLLSTSELNILKKRATKIIFDFDDAVYLHDRKAFKIMLTSSDQIIVSSPVLQKYCSELNIKAEVITTPVDAKNIAVKRNYNNPVFSIGWTGSQFTTPYLEIIRKPLEKLNGDKKKELILIGADVSFDIKNIHSVHIKWSEETEKTELQKMDVGIMPLSDDPWAEGKGGYKLFLYMAAGLPVIASPVGINKDIITNGVNGFLASTEEEWYQAFSQLYSNPDLCKKMGEKNRQLALTLYDRSVCYEKLKVQFSKLL